MNSSESCSVQVSDSGALEPIIDEILAANPAQVEQYRGGQDKVFGFFVGDEGQQGQGESGAGE
jgi:aspartyl-tRNA(Asn)/glutamyl-tRNA(Gln) amidotransferase subunit B